ncbi:tetratricopeptide repeat protein [Aquabacterium humicola]|uniref:tetratricopeptide repeat protein n=1 Tax=Aquabacterium humicola TaxID=3237377 RepID=UPI0025434424|nr:hypothetical protein [Rubrivivax pictus]
MRNKPLEMRRTSRQSVPLWRKLPSLLRRRGAPEAAEAPATVAAPEAFWDRLNALLDDCRYGEAIAALKDALRSSPHDPELNDQLHALYTEVGDTVSVLAHGPQWVAAQALDGRGRAALAALKTLQKIDARFELQDADALLPLAKAAVQHGEQALAVQLLQGFDKRFPEHPDLPGVYFLGAQLMSEYGRRHEQATKLLKRLLKRYSGHALAGEMRTYLELLQRVQVR